MGSIPSIPTLFIMIDIEPFLKKPVLLTNKFGGLFSGILHKMGSEKVVLTNLSIINKSGGKTSSKEDRSRVFKTKNIRDLKLCKL